MKKILMLIMSLSMGLVYAQNNDPVILTIEDDTVRLSEFEYVYNKNRDNKYAEEKTPEEYMELFVNFKLKVHKAEELGLDTTPQFQSELRGYRAQLARPYLVDSEVSEQLIEEAFDRYQTEIEASHILIELKPGASPEDTLKAYRRIMNIRKQVLDGDVDFAQAAKMYSDDPSAKENMGNIGYFSALYLVYPFENRAFETEVGEISMPVRTRYGYHLIYVTDRRPARGEVKAAHIMVSVKEDATEDEKTKAREKIQEIYSKLEAGEDFAALARNYSDDKVSGQKGGELRWFGANVMVEEFDSAAFSLSEIGEYSRPVRTQFGWHIIQLLDRKGYPTPENDYEEVKRKIERDSRSELSQMAVVNRLKKEYNFTEYRKNLKPIREMLTQSYLQRKWRVDTTVVLEKPLFELNGEKFFQGTFAFFLQENQGAQGLPDNLDGILEKQYENWVTAMVLSYEDMRLEEKYPKFRMIYREYRDGILLFNLMEQEVWKRALEDTTGLEAFYEMHKMEYMWPERVDAGIYTCQSKKTAKKVAKMLKKGATYDMILAKYGSDSQLAVVYDRDKYAKNQKEILSKIEWSEGVTKPIETEGGVYSVVKIFEVLEPAPKTLAEARGIFTSQYQQYLERELIETLRSSYEYDVKEEVLNQVR